MVRRRVAELWHQAEVGRDSGNPETPLGFVRWCHNRYPAERYALVLWNHGGGWAPAEVDRMAREARTQGYSPREATRGYERSQRLAAALLVPARARVSSSLPARDW